MPRLFQVFVHDAREDAELEIEVTQANNDSQPASFFTVERGHPLGPLTVSTPRLDRNGLAATMRALPDGIQFDPKSWEIRGVMRQTGAYTAFIDVVAPWGTSTSELSLIAFDPRAGSMNETVYFELETDVELELFYQASPEVRNPSYFAVGLPEGLSINPITGTVTGEVTEPGFYRYLIGFQDEGGAIGQPLQAAFQLNRKSWPSLPSIESRVIPLGDPAAGEEFVLPFSDDLTIEFLSLPQGVTFAPPRTLMVDPSLEHGFYPARLRLMNPSGFAEVGVWLGFSDPQTPGSSMRLESPSGPPRIALSGAPYHAKLVIQTDADIVAANLPDGLTFDAENRTISGEGVRSGSWQVEFLEVKGGRSVGRWETEIRVDAAAREVVATDSYVSVVVGESVVSELTLRDNPIAARLVARHLVPGATYEPSIPRFRGTATEAGRFEVPFLHAADDSLSPYRAIFNVYPRPVWEPERRRARWLPALTEGGMPKVAVLERSSPFAENARLWSTTDDITWTPAGLAGEGLTSIFTDVTATTDYVVVGQNWWATSPDLLTLNATPSSFYTFDGVAASGSLVVVAINAGLYKLLPTLTSFQDSASNPSAVAIGNSRIIGVGRHGLIEVRDLEGALVARPAPVDASLKDIIFSEGEFIAVGDHGTVLRSIDGEHWIIDRVPRLLGADFRFVTANKDWIVAMAPWTAFGRRRDGGQWEALERVSVPGSYLAELVTTDGTRIGGFAEGLYVPRYSEAGVTVLSAPCQTAIAGEVFRYAIQALGGLNLTYYVEGLPEGVRFDAGRGEIHGQIAKPGLYHVLIEATDGTSTHGKTLLIEVQPGPLRLLRHHFEIPAGSGPLTIPLSDARSTNVISDVGQVDYALGERRLSNFGETQPGEYRIRLRLISHAGNTWETITVRVLEPKPFFLTQPAVLTTAEAGNAVVLETELQGQWPITMQWYQNGKPVDGATEARLTIDALSSETVGTYALRAVNVLGETVSQSAVVRLASDPSEGYATWAAARSLGPESHFDDHNRDGRANVFDYLLGDVSTGDAPRLVETPDGERAFRFVRHRADDIDLVLQVSADLINWQDIGPGELTIETLPDERELATWPVPSETTAPRFLRFVASKR